MGLGFLLGLTITCLYMIRLHDAVYLESLESNLIGVVDKDIKSDRQKFIKLKDFVFLETAAITTTRNEIRLETHGVYLVSCQILLDTTTTERVTLEINVDDAKHSSFKSTSENTGPFEISVNGIFKANRNTLLQFFIRSQGRALIIKKNSRFSLTSLSRTDNLQAFNVRMSPLVWEYRVNRLKEISLQLWSIATVASFIGTNLFVLANGYVVARRDGVFIIAANIIFASEEKKLCKHSIVLKKNENRNIGVQNIIAEPKHWSTLSFLRFVLLNRNDRVWFDVSSTCNDVVRVHPDSTFSISELRPDFQGMSLGLSEYLSARQGWFIPDLTKFKMTLGSHFSLSSNLEVSKTFMRATSSGFVYIAINMELNLPLTEDSEEKVILAVSKNIFLDGHDDIEQASNPSKLAWVKCGQEKSTFQNLQLFAKFDVVKQDLLRIYLNIPNKKWLLLKNSSISISFNPHQTTTVRPSINKTIELSRDWQLLPHCLNYTSEYFEQFADNKIRVNENGVYHVIINYETNEFSERRDIELAVILYVKDKKTIVLYTKENEIDFQSTFKLVSSLRLHTFHKFGIFVRSNKPGQIEGKCHAQLHFFGDHDSIVGFHANMKTDFIVQGNTGYFSLSNFEDRRNSQYFHSLSYNTHGAFNWKDGIFTAPYRGVYLISINVVVKEVIMTSPLNYVAILVKINSKESPLFNLKGHNVIHNGGEDVRNSTVPFCLSAAVHLDAHDKVRIELFVNNDDQWSIHRKSSVSIVFLSQLQKGFIAYRPRNKLENTREGEKKLLIGWKESRKAPPYGMFFGSSFDSPTIQDEKHIYFTRTGLYVISMNILLNRQKTNKKIRMKLVKKVSSNSDEEVNIQCDIVETTYQEMSLSCYVIRNFQKNDLYAFQLESTSLIDAGDLYDHQSNDQNMAYLSVMLLEDVASFQAGLYNVKNDFEYSLMPDTIKQWRQHSAFSPIGNIGFDTDSGLLHVRSKGWFLITVSLQCRRTFGNASIEALRLGDVPGKALIKSKGQCNDNKRSLSMVGLQYLGDNEHINIKLSGYGGGHIIAKHSQLSFAYIKSRDVKKYTVDRKTDFFVVGDDKEPFDIPISWSTKLLNSSPVTSNLSFTAPGVYIVTINIIIITESKDIEVKLLVDSEKRLCTRNQETYLKGSRVVTISITGALTFRRGNADVSVNLKSSTKTSIEVSSTVSVAFMDTDYIKYPVVVLRMKRKVHFQSWRSLGWRHIDDFNVDVLSKFFYEDAHTLIPMYTGYYLLSCNIIVKLKKTSLVSLGLWLNDEIALNVTEHITLTDTLSISKVVYLRQGSKLSMKIMHSSKNGFIVDEGSTWSFVMLESPRGFGDDPMIPVITNALIVGNLIPVHGDEELYCHVIGGDKYTYKWYFNNTELENENSYALHPNEHFELGSGRYQCQPISNGIGPLSRSAVIKIKVVNECDRKKRICVGDDSTCIDDLVGYTCGCLKPGFKYFHRKGCALEKVSDESSAPLLILILVVCLTIIIVLICSIYICVRRRQSHRDDPERIAVVNNENPDDITMQSLNNSLTDDYSDIGTLDRQSRNGSISTVEESSHLVRNHTRYGNARRGNHAKSTGESNTSRNPQRPWFLLKNTQV